MLQKINHNIKRPVFLQIYDQVKDLIESNTLKNGDRLPSSRELGRILGVNRSTVTKAYNELLINGYTESSPGSYTIVRKRLSDKLVLDKLYNNTSDLDLLYKETIALPYDSIMCALENGERTETDKINFAQLYPDTSVLDDLYIKRCIRDTFYKAQVDLPNHLNIRGYQPLRSEIIDIMRSDYVSIEDQNILITNSSLQSLQLVFQVFSKQGDYIVVENTCDPIVLQMAKVFGLSIIKISVLSNGMDLDLLTKQLNEREIRFIYTMPTYQNPTGISMSQDKREEFLNICSEYNCLIIENGTEEEMSYTRRPFVPLKALDKRGQVIYLGTFSKIMAPALRIGWIASTSECIKKLTVLKSVFEVSTNSIIHIFLYHFIKSGAFELHLRKTRRLLKKKMNIAVNAIKQYLPKDKIEWIEPNGGCLIWIRLLTLKIENTEDYFSDFGIMVLDGDTFFHHSQENNYIRICIAQTNETEIADGFKKLGEAIRRLV